MMAQKVGLVDVEHRNSIPAQIASALCGRHGLCSSAKTGNMAQGARFDFGQYAAKLLAQPADSIE
jgi:hypothetical protein